MDPSELFSVYVLLVSSKEVLASSPEIEAVYGLWIGHFFSAGCVSRHKSHPNLFTFTRVNVSSLAASLRTCTYIYCWHQVGIQCVYRLTRSSA